MSSPHLSSSSAGESEEGSMPEILLSPYTVKQIAKAERDLFQSKSDTFHSRVTWTESVLTQILKHELEDICVKGTVKHARFRELQQLEMDEGQQWRHGTTGHPCEQLFIQRPRCTPSHSLSLSSLFISLSSAGMLIKNKQEQHRHDWRQDEQHGVNKAVSNKPAMTRNGCIGETWAGTRADFDQQQQLQQQQFQCFHLHVKQPLELIDYIKKLVSGANSSASACIVMLIYIERVQQPCQYLQLTNLNVHRVALAALLAAVKFVDDVVYSNAHYASIGGVSVQELNTLEFMFN